MYDPYGVPYPSEQLSAAMMASLYPHGMSYDGGGWPADPYPWGGQEHASGATYQMDGYGWGGYNTGASAPAPEGGSSRAGAAHKLELAAALDVLPTIIPGQSVLTPAEATDVPPPPPEDVEIDTSYPSALQQLDSSQIDPLWDGPGGAKPIWGAEVPIGKASKGPPKGAGKGGMYTPEGRRNGAAGSEETPSKMRRDYWDGPHDHRYGHREFVTPAKTARVAQQLRQLLDFYFEPFNLQHNRYLLDLLARKIGQPAKPGPWLADALLDFRFTFNDLKGLGRIAAALAKIRPAQWEAGDSGILGNLKHLTWGSSSQLLLRQPPEVRSFVEGKSSLHPEVVSAALRYLSSTREHCGQAPAKMVSVLSYALADIFFDDSPKGQLSHGRLKRQLLLHNSDIICIQGLCPGIGGEGLTQTLVDEGYAYSTAMVGDPTAMVGHYEANTIFWDSSRWQLVSREECGAALAVDLRPHEDQSVVLRAICARPEVPTTTSPGLRSLFADRQAEDGPLVVCADLTLLGGAEGTAIVEELADLRSVMMEAIGEDLTVPLGTRLLEGGMGGIQSGASGLNKLHRPDSVLFAGMAPIVALSGHTKRYLATMDSEELAQQFPAFRAPIVAAFDWHSNTASVNAASEGGNSLGWEQQEHDDTDHITL